MARQDATRDSHKLFNQEGIQSFRASLGSVAARYSDAELVQLHADIRAVARLLLDLYLLKKQDSGEAAPVGFDNPKVQT